MIFPANKSKYKILEKIYEKPGIKISELINEANVSSKVCYSHLESLKNSEIIKEELIGKKPQIRMLRPDLKSENGKLIFSLVENQKRLEFFQKYKNLKANFLHLVNNLPKNVLTVLIFGSYSRFGATKQSDLDILFILSDKRNLKDLENLVEDAFVTFGRSVSAKVLTEEEFVEAKKTDSLIKSILGEHVCVYNSMKFLECLVKTIQP